MQPVVVSGMYRSGSTRMANLLADAASRHSSLTVPASFPVVLTELMDAERNRRPYVGKGHEFTADILDALNSGRIRNVITWREPFDVCVSMVHTFDLSPTQAAGMVCSSIEHAYRLEPGECVLISSREATADNPLTISRILAAVDISVTARDLAALAYRWRRARVARLSARITGDPLASWDPVTLLHPNHVGPKRVLDDATLQAVRSATDSYQLDEKLSLLRQRHSVQWSPRR